MLTKFVIISVIVGLLISYLINHLFKNLDSTDKVFLGFLFVGLFAFIEVIIAVFVLLTSDS